MNPLYEAQLLSYMRLCDKKLGEALRSAFPVPSGAPFLILALDYLPINDYLLIALKLTFY